MIATRSAISKAHGTRGHLRRGAHLRRLQGRPRLHHWPCWQAADEAGRRLSRPLRHQRRHRCPREIVGITAPCAREADEAKLGIHTHDDMRPRRRQRARGARGRRARKSRARSTATASAPATATSPPSCQSPAQDGAAASLPTRSSPQLRELSLFVDEVANLRPNPRRRASARRPSRTRAACTSTPCRKLRAATSTSTRRSSATRSACSSANWPAAATSC